MGSTEWDFAREVNQLPLPGDERSPTHLRDEYEARVAAQGASYQLQLQLREARPDDGYDVVDGSIEWDGREHPWHELGRVGVDEVLPYEQVNRITFAVEQQPSSLGLLPARSPRDPNSINHMRARAGLAKRARLRSYALRGMPREIGAGA